MKDGYAGWVGVKGGAVAVRHERVGTSAHPTLRNGFMNLLRTVVHRRVGSRASLLKVHFLRATAIAWHYYL